MFRNLLLKLPQLKCTENGSTICRNRSLSPISCIKDIITPERTLSGSNLEQSRELCFSQKFYKGERRDSESEEIKWNDDPANEQQVTEKYRAQEVETNEAAEETESDVNTVHQFELEAARPRDNVNNNIMRNFVLKNQDRFHHLQPNQLKPFGSIDNMYSPMLITPTKYIRKLPKKIDHESEQPATSERFGSPHKTRREYSTAIACKDDRKLSTTNKCISKEGSTTRMTTDLSIPPTLKINEILSRGGSHWSIPVAIQISPPEFQGHNDEDTAFIRLFESEQKKQLRKEEQNRLGGAEYRASYSDLIKQKFREREENAVLVHDTTTGTNRMLDAFNKLPGKRHMSTRSFAKCSKDYGRKKKEKKDNKAACSDICEPFRRKAARVRAKPPLEPAECRSEDLPRKTFLPSKVRLPIAPCTPLIEHRDCRDIDPCPPRADECLEVKPKVLPVIKSSPCPCIDPYQATTSPKLHRLKMRFEDPPRPVCHPPPCQTPRADDSCKPYFKPLKPHVPQDCDCLEPAPMVDVNFKRLPKCVPEEDERCQEPPKICPEKKCPPRSDDCYRPSPKKLPTIVAGNCPCIDPPIPFVNPSMKRLYLKVNEPQKVCPPPPCTDVVRADDGCVVRPKRLPRFVAGDCPCEDPPMVDWNCRRLVCEDEARDCVVPDPCKKFPRADWGCWEYEVPVCNEVDEKCIEKGRCEPEVSNKDPCAAKKSVCSNERAGPLSIRGAPHRKLSSSSLNSGKHYQSSPPKENSDSPKLAQKLDQLVPQKLRSHSHLQFVKKGDSKITFQKVVRSINLPEKKKGLKRDNSITVSSRAISTSEKLDKSEIELKQAKCDNAKQVCKKMKSKSLVCKSKCPRYKISCSVASNRRDDCKRERPPVCCKKSEPPYSSFSDNYPREIDPFVTETPQWTCRKSRYGFHPEKNSLTNKDYRKTYSMISGKLPHATTESPLSADQEVLSLPITPIHHRRYTSQIFTFVNKGKDKKKFSCEMVDDQKKDMVCVRKSYIDPMCTKRSAPFPSFSDCLNEELERTYSECPLDKEKVSTLQPRNLKHKHLELVQPTLPKQGKIDVLKEQQCIRDKLCMSNEGLSQECNEFGKSVKLMDSRRVFEEENVDCERISELKKQGRWPPSNVKRFSTSTTNFREYHSLTFTMRRSRRRKTTRPYFCVSPTARQRQRVKKFVRFKNDEDSDPKPPSPKFTLNNCPRTTRKICRRLPRRKDCSGLKNNSPYPAFSECKDHEVVKDVCECAIDIESMQGLQPRKPLVDEFVTIPDVYPNQTKINRAMGKEYYKCKHGIKSEGQSLSCEAFKEYFDKNKKPFCSHSSGCSKTCDEIVEIEIGQHKCKDNSLLQNIPCALPEEEQFTICSQKSERRSLKEALRQKLCEKLDCSNCQIKPAKPKCAKVAKIQSIPKICPKIVKPGCSDSMWQKIVNYFKARPNCPHPDDWKKTALKNKAEKAAVRAGLIVVDPKCIPADVLKLVKSTKKDDCRSCPEGKRNFSINYQPYRNYSSRISHKDLAEINKILEEKEMEPYRKRIQRKQDEIFDCTTEKDKENSEAVKISLRMALNNHVDLSKLCPENDKPERVSYFGYTNVLPSRENILERTWRTSMETFNRNYYPKNYFADQICRRENIKNEEDFEKLKTEAVLKELDDFLQGVNDDE